MPENMLDNSVESIGLDDLQSDFLTLRVGESIPRLEIKEIRKITNPVKEDNLPRVNYKYLIESQENKLLKVNVWTLWRKISEALKIAGKIQATLKRECTEFCVSDLFMLFRFFPQTQY